eukprot:2768563-Ditylum_brightwellii.AAC.1
MEMNISRRDSALLGKLHNNKDSKKTIAHPKKCTPHQDMEVFDIEVGKVTPKDNLQGQSIKSSSQDKEGKRKKVGEFCPSRPNSRQGKTHPEFGKQKHKEGKRNRKGEK